MFFARMRELLCFVAVEEAGVGLVVSDSEFRVLTGMEG
jgi:hypothetical protein